MTEATEITHKPIVSLGMVLEEWTYKSCVAKIGEGVDFATVYHIESKEKRKGHATELLNAMKEHYEKQGKEFGSSVALSVAMRTLLKKLKIVEYK